MGEDILDYDDSVKRPDKLLSAVFFSSLALFIYWFLSGYLGLPFGEMALLIGLILLLIVTVIRFFRKRNRKLFEYLYFFGKLALFGAIFLVLSHFPGGFYMTWVAFFLFASGLIVLYFKKR